MERFNAVHETTGKTTQQQQADADQSDLRTRFPLVSGDNMTSISAGGRSGRVLAPAQSIRVQTKRGTPAASRLNFCRRVVHPRAPAPACRTPHLTRQTAHKTTARGHLLTLLLSGGHGIICITLLKTSTFKNGK